MALSGAAVGYCAIGGIVLYSGVKGATLSDTVKAVLSGNLGDLPATEQISAPTAGSPGSTADGSSIASDAVKYKGQGYVLGGNASKPGNWDCSSFASYVLGHDLGMALPGGKWGGPGFPPAAHGPTTVQYLTFGTQVPYGQEQPGDLLVTTVHMGICIGNSQMISAQDVALGTNVSGYKSGFPGGTPVVRRVASSGSGSVAAGSASAAQAYAKSRMASYGWTDAEDWNDLVSLWNRESGWLNTADTRVTHAGGDSASSTVFAYGIAQARPATKYPKAGQPPDLGGTADAETQIDWGMQDIKDAYGSPQMAWAHEQQNGWY